MARLRPDWQLPDPARLSSDYSGFAEVMNAHDAALRSGDGMYRDPITGLFVMTAVALAARPCCGNDCRHCPWES